MLGKYIRLNCLDSKYQDLDPALAGNAERGLPAFHLANEFGYMALVTAALLLVIVLNPLESFAAKNHFGREPASVVQALVSRECVYEEPVRFNQEKLFCEISPTTGGRDNLWVPSAYELEVDHGPTRSTLEEPLEFRKLLRE